MASAVEGNLTDVPDVTICSLCRKTFTEPRILPCIQTFCLGCLQEQSSRSKQGPGHEMPCPVCRKEFTVPSQGLSHLMKDSFVERLVKMKTMAGSKSEPVQCALCCDADTTPIFSASKYCIDCSDNLCETCAVHHKRQRMSREHQVTDSASLSDSHLVSMRPVTPRNCEQHPTKPVELYCTDCRLVACVTCFVEMHQGHKSSSVQKFEDFYRSKTAGNACKAAWCESMVCAMNEQLQNRENGLIIDFKEKESLILEKSQELKMLIDQQTQALLGTLSAAKQKQSEEIEKERKHLKRLLQVLATFKAYCSELASKGSAEEVCRLENAVQKRSDDFQKDIRIPRLTFQTSLCLTRSSDCNIIGTISVKECEAIVQPESSLLVVGLEACPSVTKEVIRINVNREWDVCQMFEIPTKMQQEAAGIAHYGTVFVTGIGENSTEIWKYDSTSSTWTICGSLVDGRRRHCVAFVDQILYIFGGSVDAGDGVLNSVEAYDTLSNAASCKTIGYLTHGVESAACVAYDSITYVFGGSDRDFRDSDCVQVYNTRLQTCSVLAIRMPVQLSNVRAVLWDKYAILMSEWTCLLFNFKTGTWQTRERFKTDFSNFGLALVGDRIFVVGGETWVADRNARWNRTDAVRYVPVENVIVDTPIEWKIHAKLPRPGAVQTCVHMAILSNRLK